jgi:GNAT superfamily N-acetyltransferase
VSGTSRDIAVVRLAEPGDAAGIAAVKIASWRTAYEGLLPPEVLGGLEHEVEERAWRGYVEAMPPADRLWVAVEAGAVIGFARTGPASYPDLPATTAELYGLYLHPAWFRSGRGRALLAHAVSDLTARGHAPVVLWHFTGNERASAVYERAGFRLDGAVRRSDFGVDETRRRFDP